MDSLTLISLIITPILLIVVILLIVYLGNRKPQQENSNYSNTGSRDRSIKK